jgi:hypothetical protein
MALIKCPECKAEISDQAKSCPKCGEPIRAKKTFATRLGWANILFGLFFGWLFHEDTGRDNSIELWFVIACIGMMILGALSVRKIKWAFKALVVFDLLAVLFIIYDSFSHH